MEHDKSADCSHYWKLKSLQRFRSKIFCKDSLFLLVIIKPSIIKDRKYSWIEYWEMLEGFALIYRSMYVYHQTFMLWYLDENTVGPTTTGALVHEPYQI